MKLIVFSDSHGDVTPMLEIIKITKPDLVIHLGDHIRDAMLLRKQFTKLKIEAVKGNCDLGSTASSYKLLHYNGVEIFITHGDEFGVRHGTSGVLKEGIKHGAKVILFGHTHQPVIKKKKGVTMMNPGRIGRRARGFWQPSFGILDIGESADCSLEYYEEFLHKNK